MLLAGMNWCLVRGIVGRRLHRLSDGLSAVADHVSVGGTSPHGQTVPVAAKLPAGPSDALGLAARAFNTLLDALERERRFRTVIHASRDVTVMIGTDGVIVFASASVQSVLGWDPAAVLGARLQDAVHQKDRALLEDLLHPLPGPAAAVPRAGGHEHELPQRPITVRVAT
ncbi:PAS domain S-box protein, partial [Aquipuribacter hungaricus]|uniref:PAS domain S-box protein n=1 Tax=Aquipuribacter hungaricus TaxID=545624 RepID=UPI0030EC6A02